MPARRDIDHITYALNALHESTVRVLGECGVNVKPPMGRWSFASHHRALRGGVWGVGREEGPSLLAAREGVPGGGEVGVDVHVGAGEPYPDHHVTVRGEGGPRLLGEVEEIGLELGWDAVVVEEGGPLREEIIAKAVEGEVALRDRGVLAVVVPERQAQGERLAWSNRTY